MTSRPNFDLSKIELSVKDISRGIVFPKKLTDDLAEFIGIMVGDGHLDAKTWKKKDGQKAVRYNLKISGNKAEEEYLSYIQHLFKSLFNLNLIYMQDTSRGAIILRAHSKGIVNFLNKVCQIPVNKKNNSVGVPNIIREGSVSIKYAFLRGLADTDFTLTFKNRGKRGHNYPLIKASFKSKKLVQDLEVLYRECGFRYSTYYNEVRDDKRFGRTVIHNIYLYGKDNLRKWIKTIGFSNQKFRRKIEKWEKDGVCPPGY